MSLISAKAAVQLFGPSTPAEIAGSVATWVSKHLATIAGGARKVLQYLPSAYRIVNGAKGLVPKPRKNRGRGRLPIGFDGVTSYNNSTSPIAYNYSEHNSTMFHQESIGRSDEYGSGCRAVGRQYATDISTTNVGAENLFSGGISATGNIIILNPDELGARIALLARCFTVFVFRHVRICYMPRVATTQEGAAIMAYVQDGALETYADLNYETAHQVEDNVKFPYRAATQFEMNYFGTKVWFCEIDLSSGDPGIRQTAQGLILGFADTLQTGSGLAKMGDVMIEYVCDFYGPVCDLGFAAFDRFSRTAKRELNDLFLTWAAEEQIDVHSHDGSFEGMVIRRLHKLSPNTPQVVQTVLAATPNSDLIKRFFRR